ncbi:MAG: tetratricopeptide repeat protein [Anaerolineae bacterium]
MNPSFLILFVGLLYILGFGALSFMRRQGLSTRFAVEGLILTAVGAALVYVSVPIHPLFFFVILYLITMRVRLLVDLGNWLTSRQRYEQALSLFRVALRLGADESSRQIVLINQGVTRLRMGEPDEAYTSLRDALGGEKPRVGAKYLAAGYYNLGLACRRTGREAEAIRYFNEAIDTWPNSIYARAAKQALKKRQSGP